MIPANIKVILYYIIGALVGAGSAGLIVNQVNKNRFPPLDEGDDTDDVRKDWHPIDKDEDAWTKPDSEWVEAESKNITDVPAKKGKMRDDVTDYTKFTHQSKPKIDDFLAMVDKPLPVVDEGTGPGPHIINYDQYIDLDGPAGRHKQISLTCYALDKVVVDVKTLDPIPNPELAIGHKALDTFGDGTNEDPDLVFVRNNTTMVDYEIVRLDKSYSEDVLGVEPEKPQKKTKKRAGSNATSE